MNNFTMNNFTMNNFTTELLNNTTSINSSPDYLELITVIPILIVLLVILISYKNNTITKSKIYKKNQILPV